MRLVRKKESSMSKHVMKVMKRNLVSKKKNTQSIAHSMWCHPQIKALQTKLHGLLFYLCGDNLISMGITFSVDPEMITHYGNVSVAWATVKSILKFIIDLNHFSHTLHFHTAQLNTLGRIRTWPLCYFCKFQLTKRSGHQHELYTICYKGLA